TSGNQASFVTAISMDVVGGNPWAANATTDWNSALPNGLNVAQVVGFNTEYDNAKYDCSPFSGTSLELQLAINNDNGFGVLTLDGSNNWNENNTGGSIQIKPSCSFCCSSTGFPNLSGPSMANTNSSISISISGTLPMGESWQLFTAGCGVGSPLQTTTGNSFNVTGPATAQSVTYYVRSSGTLDCSGLCGQLTVCFQTDIYATCTTCGADPSACGVCYLPSPAANPTPSIGCYAMSIAFVLDESGSIGSNASDVEDGVLAFLNALNGQDAQVALIEFDDLATVVNGYTVVNQTYIDAIEGYFNGAPYNGQTYSPGGSTNWHDAMKKVDALTPPDVVIFFTDGVPTAWTNLSNNADYCGDGSTTQTPEIVNPVKLANKIKGEGTHMFMLGVGTGINSTNLQQ
ncbi:MAG TPA: vWA domain-containing protein, partial [Saprospiraceae bacterium]|nr:vWA domain-containing protein [Saprospiraceae bacterium]